MSEEGFQICLLEVKLFGLKIEFGPNTNKKFYKLVDWKSYELKLARSGDLPNTHLYREMGQLYYVLKLALKEGLKLLL